MKFFSYRQFQVLAKIQLLHILQVVIGLAATTVANPVEAPDGSTPESRAPVKLNQYRTFDDWYALAFPDFEYSSHEIQLNKDRRNGSVEAVLYRLRSITHQRANVESGKADSEITNTVVGVVLAFCSVLRSPNLLEVYHQY